MCCFTSSLKGQIAYESMVNSSLLQSSFFLFLLTSMSVMPLSFVSMKSYQVLTSICSLESVDVHIHFCLIYIFFFALQNLIGWARRIGSQRRYILKCTIFQGTIHCFSLLSKLNERKSLELSAD